MYQSYSLTVELQQIYIDITSDVNYQQVSEVSDI
jgi:hypothetical protein